MSEKAEQNAPERCSCCTCGYTWVKGQHGGHSCAQVMEVTVADLRARLAKYEDDQGNQIGVVVPHELLEHAASILKNANSYSISTRELAAAELRALLNGGRS